MNTAVLIVVAVRISDIMIFGCYKSKSRRRKFCGRNVNVAAFRSAIVNKCMPSGNMLIAFAVDRNSTVIACRNAVVFILQIFCLIHLFVLHTISIKIVCFVDGL